MRKSSIKIILLSVILIVLIGAISLAYQFLRQNVNLTAFTSQAGIAAVDLPPGFEMDVYAEGLDGPRFMTFGPDRDLFVAERASDRIMRLPDRDQNGVADSLQVFHADLNQPHSIVYHQGSWYVGVPTGIIRLDDEDQDGSADRQTVIVDNIPGSGQHTTRTVEFLPDGRMLLSVGSSCNACIEDDPRRAAIVVYEHADAGGSRIFASGLRNAVGMTIRPGSDELWVTNNARDLMGDDIPPDSVHTVKEGQSYGWPFCHAGDIPDPDLADWQACQAVPQPALQIQAHSAPLGLVFYDGATFPAEYQGGLFIAYHGSWNRTIPTGYKVVFAPFEGSSPTGEIIDFAVGWLDPETNDVYGRPVGLAIGPDGALYISDDKAGVVYRIQYNLE